MGKPAEGLERFRAHIPLGELVKGGEILFLPEKSHSDKRYELTVAGF